MIEDITPLIVTYNEAENIARTLDRLTWARRIVVIDSGSTDETLEIVRSYPQAQLIYRQFDNFANQWNFGNEQVREGWVLSLDADYELSDELVSELRALRPDRGVFGYRARFVYRVLGHSLRASLYPPRIVLYRQDRSHYRNDGHTQRLVIAGEVLPLSGIIFHDDRKSLARWLTAQQRYACEEAEYLLHSNYKSLGRADRIRRAVWPAPLLVFFYTLMFKGCLLDGWPGWHYALQRLLAETLISIEIIDRRLRQNGRNVGQK